jgi:sialate O-acetylesterase
MKKRVFTVVLCGVCLSMASADVQLPSIFGEHMVLQQGVPLPVWGKAEPGEQVKVSFAGKEVSGTADAKGDWKLKLEAVPASDQPGEFVVTGKNTVKFADVLVGEVWVCSGQSNMVASSRNLVSKEVGEKKQIRFFITPQIANIEPQDNVEGKWVVCEPNPTFDNPYSGVGYHFAVDLEKNRRCPVGMIQSAWGGTAIAPWITLAAF